VYLDSTEFHVRIILKPKKDGIPIRFGGINIVVTAQIMLVDDFKPWRLKLRSILEAIPGFRIVGEAGDAYEAIEKASRLLPDIVLLDIGMPILNGLEAAPRIRRASPRSKIVFLTQEQDSEVRNAALAAGADGYLLKSEINSELRPAINAALRSVCPCPPAEFYPTARLEAQPH
jgi:DNA-binding NarL/FixJ family response regulator